MTGSVKLSHDKVPGIEVYFVEVTPAVAKELLALNTRGQRTISAAAVERYASDMTTHDWYVNGDTIKISKKNELLDGQHRLSSIIASGEGQVLLIVHGLDKDAMLTIDAGRKRTYSDMLKMRGMSNHALTAAIIGRSWFWYRGNYGVRNVGRIETPQFLGATPSHAQKDLHLAKLEKEFQVTFEAAAAFGHKAYQKRPGISSSTYGVAWIILTGIDRQQRNLGEESDLREQFFHEILVEAKSSKLGYPIQALHNRLNRLNKNGSDALDNVDQLDAIFTVFNAWMEGKQIDTVRRPPRPIRHNLLAIPNDFKECNL